MRDSVPVFIPTLAVASSSLFFNRELSWLAFNERVLHEAQDERTPLLEAGEVSLDFQHESRT